ncbi:MAG: flagellin, partial [Phycisphaeraceae bacterium]|nr:flagellin [Phycisphaeraceae bacterium]
LDTDFKALTTERAQIGVRGRRLENLQSRIQDQKLQTQSLLSIVQDADYTETISRFTQLQQQLEANLASSASVMGLSLLDFLR